MDSNRIRTIIEYIESHASERLPLDRLADTFGYSTDYFAEIFRKHTDMSVASYIRRYKLSLAAYELLSGASSGALAAKYGFVTASGFSKAFRRYYHMSPSEYRATYALDPLPSFKRFPDLKAVAYLFPAPDETFSLSVGGAYWWKKDFSDVSADDYAKIHRSGTGDIGAWMQIDGKLQYACGPITEGTSFVPEHMHEVTIPAATYAVFTAPRGILNSEIHRNIVDLWNYLYKRWFVSGELTADDGKVAFELYHDGDIDIYVPVKPGVHT